MAPLRPAQRVRLKSAGVARDVRCWSCVTRTASSACLAALASALIGSAVPVAASGAALLSYVEAPAQHVGLEQSGDRLVGYVRVPVRNETNRPGRLTARYVPERPGPVLELPGARRARIVLVKPVSGRTLTRAPRVAPGAVAELVLRASLPEGDSPRELDGRLSLRLETGAGRRLGDELVVALVFRRVGKGSALSIELVLAGLSALAAVVAGLLAGLTARQAREARLPLLSLSVADRLGREAADPDALELTVTNSGGGVATGTHCCLVTDGCVQHGPLYNGTLLPGQHRTVLARGSADRYEAVMFCWDSRGRYYVWDSKGRRRRLKAPTVTYVTAFEHMFQRAPSTGGRDVIEGFRELEP